MFSFVVVVPLLISVVVLALGCTGLGFTGLGFTICGNLWISLIWGKLVATRILDEGVFYLLSTFGAYRKQRERTGACEGGYVTAK